MQKVIAATLACTAFGGCIEPQAPGLEPSAELRAASAPELGATASLRSAGALAPSEAERLRATGADLATRGEALRERASALRGPVIPPQRRARLDAATAPRHQP